MNECRGKVTNKWIENKATEAATGSVFCKKMCS